MTEQTSLDRLTGIVAFSRAASLGSFTAAARSLSISPSAVSKSIQRLEQRLGVALFTRTTRSLTLTKEGRDLQERAVRLLRDVEAIEQAAVASRSEPSGVLKVTAPIPIGVHFIAPHLPKFTARYPSVCVDLRLSDTFTDLVEEGVDVAVRVGPPADGRLIAKTLAENPVCAFASKDYLARRGAPLVPQELDDHSLVNVRFPSSGMLLQWPFRVERKVLEYTPNAAVLVDSSDAVATVVANGGGIGMIPLFVAQAYLARGELVPVLSRYRVNRGPITALWPESRRSSPNVRAFVRFLGDVFPDPSPWHQAYLALIGERR